MTDIKVDVALYGTIAKHAGGQFVAQSLISLQEGATVENLMDYLGIQPDEKGYLFINAVLSDAPGLYASRLETLHDGDHIGIFSITHMWPYQYRDGVRMTDSLKAAMREKGTMHNVYKKLN